MQAGIVGRKRGVHRQQHSCDQNQSEYDANLDRDEGSPQTSALIETRRFLAKVYWVLRFHVDGLFSSGRRNWLQLPRSKSPPSPVVALARKTQLRIESPDSQAKCCA